MPVNFRLEVRSYNIKQDVLDFQYIMCNVVLLNFLPHSI